MSLGDMMLASCQNHRPFTGACKSSTFLRRHPILWEPQGDPNLDNHPMELGAAAPSFVVAQSEASDTS